ncbi:hypothetical protein SDRG_08803 [Saprolegnia diclina VS20]|uniref:Secreted protein n=1 Tax=Saprolegnia diclina (strain VS20) TaxID=1156394 RepID=T0Q751_SAPDV|nr:hypothetical protein SDRG_08803 [Saprolegnia diclina VS20]EQC33699.1 hypothetical protein SDRG_08803 [Saprolegnia diclina VS20]|eukprot:XP_008612922.1 hypothetical protein SDRG_08803 [Saprolegnia diclina VS20]
MRPLAAAIGLAAVLAAPADLGLGPPVLPQVLTTLLDAYKPLLANYTAAQLPATIGNCGAASPPTPCMDSGGNLYEDTSSDWYKVTARWISGINTMSLTSLAMSFDDAGALALNVVVNFKELPMSLRVEGCLFNACAMVLDNTKYCCGNDKTVTMTASATCNETYPFVRNVVFSDAQITPPMTVQVTVAGKAIKLKDVTTAAQDGIKTAAGSFLQTKGIDLLNSQIKDLFGTKVYCSQASKDRQTPAPTTTPPPTTARPTVAPTTATVGSQAGPSPKSNAPTTQPSNALASSYHTSVVPMLLSILAVCILQA